MSTLLLGFAAAAVAFGVHEVAAWGAGWPALIGAIAGSAWASSFLAGITWAHSIQSAMRINALRNEGAGGPSRAGYLAALFDSLNRRGARAYKLQLHLLLIGAVVFAVGQGIRMIGAENPANERRCLAIQRDMLSARPRRADGPDLFRALGCQARGEGSVYAPAQASSISTPAQ